MCISVDRALCIKRVKSNAIDLIFKPRKNSFNSVLTFEADKGMHSVKQSPCKECNESLRHRVVQSPKEKERGRR